MKLIETVLPGMYEVEPLVARDGRGVFVKVFNRPAFAGLGLATDFAEAYYSTSAPRVLRGLHFQVPPMDHAKLVYCTAGGVIDVAVDLRVGSPTYGRHAVVELDAVRGNMVYIPQGLAHGFYVPSDDGATVAYMVTTPYSKEHDAGIRWDSAGVAWPDGDPIMSDRDRALPTLEAFRSPFTFGGPKR